jgi:hypothetical protein
MRHSGMNKKRQKLFEKREAVQYLIEDNEIACIELNMKLRKFEKYLRFGENYAGIRSNFEPSLIFSYMYAELYKRHLVEMEFIRERTNRNYLMSLARKLWQK